MRKFNPDKELNKIRNGRKNKVMLSICTLLLIIAIGSTFALYQVRHTNKIVFNTVGEFKKKDIIISVKLDDNEESVDSFPQKEDGYVYSHMECEQNNITNISWDEEHWKLNADINGQDKCTVYFAKSPFHMKSCENKSMAECLLNVGQKFKSILAFDDPDQNGRYIGANPNNYIWFNCKDYDNLTNENAEDEQHKCEKWRIIGAFKNMKKVNEDDTQTSQNLVKILRINDIIFSEWNTDNKNDWTNASLQKLLNEDYLDSSNGTFTESSNNKAINMITNNIIEKVIWNLGGSSAAATTASEFYNYERGEKTYNNQPREFPAKIGLVYASDYGYATSGNDKGINRESCLSQHLDSWSSEIYQQDCAFNDWMFRRNINQWTLSTHSGNGGGVFAIYVSGYVSYYGRTDSRYTVYPSLYLKSTTKITSGSGTFEEPYIIS